MSLTKRLHNRKKQPAVVTMTPPAENEPTPEAEKPKRSGDAMPDDMFTEEEHDYVTGLAAGNPKNMASAVLNVMRGRRLVTADRDRMERRLTKEENRTSAFRKMLEYAIKRINPGQAAYLRNKVKEADRVAVRS